MLLKTFAFFLAEEEAKEAPVLAPGKAFPVRS
jgi:hypothetical protein